MEPPIPTQDDLPDSARQTVPIRPLRRWVSRLVVTAAIVAACGLSVYASALIRSMSKDPQVRATLEAAERVGSAAADTAGTGQTPPDSTGVSRPQRSRPDSVARGGGIIP